MKYLEGTPELSRINSTLRSLDVGEYVIRGIMECWSCKLAGMDKKLSRSLDQEVVTGIASSPAALSCSPVGPLSDAGSRKTLIYLILTLNHGFPDYDFSNLRAHHFNKEEGVWSAKGNIDTLLMEPARLWNASVGGSNMPLLESMWAAIDEVIQLVDCDVYSYKGEIEGDPFEVSGSLWSFNYFFYNRKLKRILFFTCAARSKAALEEDGQYEGEEDDADFADEMDL